MHTSVKWLPAVTVVPLLLAAAAPGVAATGENYHGVYDGTTSRVGCTSTPASQDVTGTWNVRISGDKVTATTNVFYDGRHHLAWGGAGFTLLSDPAGPGFTIESDLADGATLTMSLDEAGALTYVVAPYKLFGYDCASLTLTGHAG